jgi:hypothetical protein
MPFLSSLIEAVFPLQEPRERFLAWLSVFYASGYNQKPQLGQNVFIVGPTNIGKTFLNRYVVGGLVGGFKEATEYLLGDDGFGSELYESPLWVMDDATMRDDPKRQRIFSEMLKRMAANAEFRCHGKYQTPVMVQWLGRILGTANDDPESIAIIPDMALSNQDKICLFLTGKQESATFANEMDKLGRTQQELPYLARYLLDFKFPPHCLGDSRYVVPVYHDPFLLVTARQATRLADFAEVLQTWLVEYASASTDPASHWEGNSFDLFNSLSTCFGTSVRNLTQGQVSRFLAALSSRDPALVSVMGANGTLPEQRRWRIRRPVSTRK